MRSRCSSPVPSHINSTASSPDLTPRNTLSSAMMLEKVATAEEMIRKWDVDASSSYTKFASLFSEDRAEARRFLNSVKELQSAMHFFMKDDSNSELLVHSHKMMTVGMKRLQKEFYHILSVNKNFLDPQSVSTMSSRASARSSVSDFEEDNSVEDAEVREAVNYVSEEDRVSEMAMADLKLIADSMSSSGYGHECVKIYKIIRKSIVDETLYYLGVEKLSLSQIQKRDWDSVELKIRTWLHAVKVAVRTLFNGERILSDRVFGSEKIRESCFSEVCKEGALMLLIFPENVAKCKKSPEKMFRMLDLYESIADLWPEIQSIFSHQSTSIVLSQAMSSLVKIGDAVRVIFSDFEAAIEKDSSKSPVLGGGLHPLCRYVMNYVVFLSDYSGVLSDILTDWNMPVRLPLPESYFSDDGESESPVSVRLAWTILVLLCKLDGKAMLYKDVPLSYLFLANNLNYIVSKVRSSNLKFLLGEEWLSKHEAKVRQYAGNYVRMAWGKVVASIPEDPTAEISLEEAEKCFTKFNSAFEAAYRKQSAWVVPDKRLREEIKIMVAKKVGPVYREFYDKYRPMFQRDFFLEEESVVRYAPDDLGNYVSDLFYGNGGGGGSSTASHSPSASPPVSRDGRARETFSFSF